MSIVDSLFSSTNLNTNTNLVYYLPFMNSSNIANDICGNKWTVTGTPTTVYHTSNNYTGGKLCKLKPGDGLSISNGSPFWRKNGEYVNCGYTVDFWMTVFPNTSGQLGTVSVNFNINYKFSYKVGTISYNMTNPVTLVFTPDSCLIPFVDYNTSTKVYYLNTNYKKYTLASTYKDPEGNDLYHFAFLFHDLYANTATANHITPTCSHHMMRINYTNIFYQISEHKTIANNTNLNNQWYVANGIGGANNQSSPIISLSNPSTNTKNIYIGHFRLMWNLDAATQIPQSATKGVSFIFDNMIIK